MAKSSKKKFDDEIRSNLRKSALRMSATMGTQGVGGIYELDAILKVLGQEPLMQLNLGQIPPLPDVDPEFVPDPKPEDAS